MGKEKVRKGEREEMGQKLESMEEFLRTRNLEGGLCYESPKKEIISHIDSAGA